MIVSYEYVKLLGHNYARPMLEYHSPILWSPVAVTLINQLESLQRRFTKRLYRDLRRYRIRRALCFTGTRPSGASSITYRLIYFFATRLYEVWFCCQPTGFSRLVAIQEHLVIHLNCFYRIRGLIVDIICFAVRMLRIMPSVL